MARVAMLLVLLLALLTMAAAAMATVDVSSEDLASEASLRALYERWYALYRREDQESVVPAGGDKEKRFANFKQNAHTVHELNLKEGDAGARVKYQLNSLSDLTHQEYAESFASCSPAGVDNPDDARGTAKRHQPSSYYPDNLPLAFDWRKVDAVSGVKHQGYRCGCCWAFAATAAMESLHFIENEVRTTLSVQELVDCSTDNLGCNGGWASKAFQYVIDNGGIGPWGPYPYTEEKSSCVRPLNRPVMAIRSFHFVEPRNQKMLMDAVIQRPVVVRIAGANTTAFWYYRSGVFRGPCDTMPWHEALLVGYGTTLDNDPNDPAGINFWIIKNSWGEGWGEAGYMRLLRGFEADGGLCGIMFGRNVYPADAYST